MDTVKFIEDTTKAVHESISRNLLGVKRRGEDIDHIISVRIQAAIMDAYERGVKDGKKK